MYSKMRNRLADLKKREESNLEERRIRYDSCFFKLNRLKALLEAEDKVYEQEFMANLETPE
jgi:hypothetical protein